MKRHARLVAALVIVAVAVAVGTGMVLRQRAFGLVRVAGSSMAETLISGDLALVTRFDYVASAPERGDVVECRFPGRSGTYIKRVVGLPGDDVAFENGGLVLNGTAVEEPYLSTSTEDYRVSLGADEYLLLGDNRAESYDSRMADMGPVGRADIRGRARWIILPLNRFGPIH